MKKLLIGGMILSVFLVGVSVYAFTNQKITWVNPNGEQVFVDEEGSIFTHYEQEEEEDLGMSFVYYAGDVIGTKVGTTTTGVNFRITVSGGQSATSTYIKKTGGGFNQAIYTIGAINASSSSNFQMSFLGSNDQDCDTASSTTSYADIVLTGEVNWFDIGDHLRNKVHSTSLAAGTSTLVWDNPVAGTGRTVILTDLSYECLALQVSGSSTNIWTQLKLK